MNNCKGIFGRLFGHNFKAIYDTKDFMPSENLDKTKEFELNIYSDLPVLASQVLLDTLDALRTHEKIYIKSVCSRCGKVPELILMKNQ